MTFPTHHQASEVLQPCEEPLDFPAPLVAPELSPVLAVRSCAISAVRGDQLDSVLGQLIVQSIAVIPLIGNQPFRLLGHEAVLDGNRNELLLMWRSTRNPKGDRKTMAVCDCHELGPFADERSTNAIAPFFAPMKEASMNASSNPSCPRANRSSASAQRMPLSTPERCQCWNRRWQVWYGPYRTGRSGQGAPVRNTHNTPFSTCRASRQGLPRLSARRRCPNSTKGLIRSHCTSVRSAMPLVCFNLARESSFYSRDTFMR
jgi:hypothetical protein